MRRIILSLTVWFAVGAVSAAELTELRVLPSATDPEIKTFDSPHGVCVNREIVVDHKSGLPADRRELLLWLTGTGGPAGNAARAFRSLAANEGYHVISLMYPNEVPATVCRNDEDPRAFESFRMAIIQGGETKHVSIARPESIEHRLIALLRFLRDRRPREDWGQFLTDDGAIRWERVALAGQSQGGGHAALIGLKHPVARVICTGAPKDYSRRLKAPAAWLRLESATPKRRFFTFNHVSDSVGCSPEEQMENLRALGLTEFGPPVDVTKEAPPYHNARVLVASHSVIAASTPDRDAARAAHASVIANSQADRWRDVWTYMLAAEVE